MDPHLRAVRSSCVILFARVLVSASTLLLLVSTLCTSGCTCVEESPLQGCVSAGVPIPDSAMTHLLSCHRVPGVSVAVIHLGRIDWARGYGVREYGKPEYVDTSTLFQAASISKPVAAVAALRMVARGELDLDEDVNFKLRSWRVPENELTRVHRVTLRRLLSHSAGFNTHGVPEFSASSQLPTLVQILAGSGSASGESVRVVIEPGSAYRYSGGGYIVMQLLMTDVARQPFAQLASELVLKPAGMRFSTFEQPLPQELHTRAAVGHLSDGSVVSGLWHTLPEQAAGGLWATPTDLALFAIELWRSYHGKSDTLLPQHLARQMLTRQIDNFGLGLSLPGAGIFRFQHGGANGGYRCHLVLSVGVPDGVVIMTNGDAGEKVINEVFQALAHAYGWGV
jgi:CubicO group peptidase (beta-lactamase class C family)